VKFYITPYLSVKKLDREILSLQYQKVGILLTYLHNIDIDIATFCKYRIDIASRLKK